MSTHRQSIGPGAEGSKARAEGAKTQRHENMVQLRKDKRRAAQAKRRRTDAENPDNDKVCDLAEVQKQVSELKGTPVGKRASQTKAVRVILSTHEANVGLALQAEPQLVGLLVQSLQQGGAEEKLEAAWCITNIASGTPEQTSAALAAVPFLIAHLRSADAALQEQCLWALSNMAGDQDQGIATSLIHTHGAVPPMVFCLASDHTFVSQCAAWALSNTLRGQSNVFLQLLSDNSPASLSTTLHRFFHATKTPSETHRLEVLWLLSYLTNSSAQVNNKLVELGILDFILQSLTICFEGGYSDEVVIPSVRVIGNMTSGDEAIGSRVCQTKPQLCGVLVMTLQSPRKVIVKEDCWALSNLTAGSDSDVVVFASNPAFLPTLVNLLMNADFDIKKEAAFCVANFCSNGRHIDQVVRAGAVPAFLALLRSPDPEAINVSLSVVGMVLEFHTGGLTIVEELDGVEVIEGLVYHEAVGAIATKIIDTYFPSFRESDV